LWGQRFESVRDPLCAAVHHRGSAGPRRMREVAQGVYRKRLLRPGLVQAHKGEVSAMGGNRALDDAYVEVCRAIGPARLSLFGLRVIADTFGILAKGQGL